MFMCIMFCPNGTSVRNLVEIRLQQKCSVGIYIVYGDTDRKFLVKSNLNEINQSAGARRAKKRPVNLWRSSVTDPIASAIDVLFWLFLLFFCFVFSTIF